MHIKDMFNSCINISDYLEQINIYKFTISKNVSTYALSLILNTDICS